MFVYSAYVGKLDDLEVDDYDGERACLRSTLPGMLPMMVYTLDASELSQEEVEVCIYEGDPLKELSVIHVDLQRTHEHHTTLHNCRESIVHKREATRYNGAVDAHYNACRFVHYMREILCIYTMDHSSSIVILYGVKNKVGASYYGGGVVAVGMGDRTNNPASSADIIGHELTHGLQTRREVSQGEYGALLEHFSDSLGVSFESYVYNQIRRSDQVNWTLGEDMKRKGSIRSLKDPESLRCPARYLGRYWVTVSGAFDAGGIHTNCSVGNHFFYLLSERVGLAIATQILADVMYRCPKSYTQYAIDVLDVAALYEGAPLHGITHQCRECLQACGLAGGERCPSSYCILL